jgi:hypothetical protein
MAEMRAEMNVQSVRPAGIMSETALLVSLEYALQNALRLLLCAWRGYGLEGCIVLALTSVKHFDSFALRRAEIEQTRHPFVSLSTVEGSIDVLYDGAIRQWSLNIEYISA